MDICGRDARVIFFFEIVYTLNNCLEWDHFDGKLKQKEKKILEMLSKTNQVISLILLAYIPWPKYSMV